MSKQKSTPHKGVSNGVSSTSRLDESLDVAGERRSEQMRRNQFRIAASAMVPSVVLAVAFSDPNNEIVKAIAYAMTSVLVLIFAITSLAPRRSFEIHAARPVLALTWCAGLCALRLMFEAPNLLYVPIIVFAFFIASTNTMRSSYWAAAMIGISGMWIIGEMIIGGSWSTELEKLAFSYALAPSFAMLLIGYLVSQFQSSLDEVERTMAVSNINSDDDGVAPSTRAEIPAESRLCEQLSITAGQAKVVALLVSGSNNAEIAAQLGLSTRTVQNHVRATLERTGLRSRTQLAVVAALTLEPIEK